MAIVLISCWLVLGVQASRIAAFGWESRSFETVLVAAKPNARALAVVQDRHSAAASNVDAYSHYPLWYQADKHGLVDFNFAFFPQEVIRFSKRENGSEPLGQYTRPERYIELYKYVFVRGSVADVDNLKKKIACSLTTIASDGPWFLLERGACLEKVQL